MSHSVFGPDGQLKGVLKRASHRTLKFSRILFPLGQIAIVCLPFIIWWQFLAGAPERSDESKNVLLGERARKAIPLSVPKSATDCYFWTGGSFNGTIDYWAFTCDSIDECWSALLSDRFIDKDNFHLWKSSEYAVVMKGPGFYGEELKTPLWDVSAIKNGVVDERVRGNCDNLWFYAIDFDHCRVFGHYESGGFPCDKIQLARDSRTAISQ